MVRVLGSSLVIALFVVAALLRLPGGVETAYAIECSDFPNQQFAQLTLRVLPQDPHDLDGANDNGIACEGRPCPCDTEAVEEAVGDRVFTPSGNSSAAQTTTPAAPSITPAVVFAASATPSSPSPAATVEPTTVPAGSLSVITPPSTGSAGLR